MTIVREALSNWNIQPTHVALAAKRENIVYRVTTAHGEYALRQHRQGYRTDAELISELAWMAALDDAGITVPTPIACKNGALLTNAQGTQFSMLAWLSGRQLGAHSTPLDLPTPIATLHTLGAAMANLHTASDAWTPPPDFTRPAWDTDGLVGEEPLWGRFWENPTLTPEQIETLQTFRVNARTALTELGPDYGLIHADLLRENVLVDGDTVHLIDFDDGGYGFRLFDIATTLFRLKDEQNFPDLQAALIEGYLSQRNLDTSQLPLFYALRSCTYIGWIVTRMETENAKARNLEHIAFAMTAINNWNSA